MDGINMEELLKRKKAKKRKKRKRMKTLQPLNLLRRYIYIYTQGGKIGPVLSGNRYQWEKGGCKERV
jgi:hypothetical protein